MIVYLNIGFAIAILFAIFSATALTIYQYAESKGNFRDPLWFFPIAGWVVALFVILAFLSFVSIEKESKELRVYYCQKYEVLCPTDGNI